jgi:SAM-dependent methyltransferase
VIGPGSRFRRVVRGAIRRLLGVPRIRAIVAAELAADRRVGEPRRASPVAPTVHPVLPPTFTDERGIAHPLDPTLRDRLKPGWPVMIDPVAAARPPDDAWLRARATKATTIAADVARTLARVGGGEVTGRILEFGCFDGAVAQAFAALPGTSVVASDLSRYYVVQRPDEPSEAELAAEDDRLTELRRRAAAAGGWVMDRVTFVEDDITRSALEPGSFDLIVSFEVLEHVARPADTFQAIARLLRPGGVTYHDYNPFFSQIGGHSLLTLDFPWGHARLSPDDLGRYLREVRPGEAEQATRFATESLNRMTHADLRDAIAGAGLELLAFVPWPERRLLPELDAATLDEVRRSHPRVTLEDLLATYVTVVARRPLDGAAT